MTSPIEPDSDLLTADEVARILGVTATRIRQLDDVLRPTLRPIREGSLKLRKIYSREVLELYRAERR